jgi:hypothetical protein
VFTLGGGGGRGALPNTLKGRDWSETEELPMSTTTPPRAVRDTGGASAWAAGLALFSGVLMSIVGVNQVLLGISALLHDGVYVQAPDYVYRFDLNAWGWVHLVFGLLLVLIGISVVRGLAWARGVGIGLVALNLIANFLFIPYYPVWSLLIVALDVAVIWGLAAHRDDTL